MPRILVVDDEPDICQMIRRYAEHDGYGRLCCLQKDKGAEGHTCSYAICQRERIRQTVRL